MKVRVVQNRRGWTVHGFSCPHPGRGTEHVVEAPTAIEVADALEESSGSSSPGPLGLRFADCARFGVGKPDAAPTPTISRRDPLAVKIDTVSTWAEDHGWDVEDDGGETVTLTRQHSEATETIRVVFKGNSYDRGNSGYFFNHPESLRDLNTVLLRIAARPGTVLDASARRRTALPFGMGDSDAVVLDVLAGKLVKWVNSISLGEESARVPELKAGTGRHIKIDTTSTGRRVLAFPDGNGGGFRAVGLDAIVEVRG